MKKKKPRVAKVCRIIHVQHTVAYLDEVAHRLQQEIMTGRNFEDREEWARAWADFKRQSRDRGR
jgi:hypothetical protein